MTDTGVAPTGPAAGIVSAGEQTRIASDAADAPAASTRRTYAGQWAGFEAWCRARGAQALPAAPVLVAAYLTERAETARISTVRVAAAAIGAAHRARGADDPTATVSVSAVVAGIARQHAASADAAPLSFESAVMLLVVAQQPRRTGRGVESARVAAARSLEDGAIVSLTFCAGLRRSEIAALRWQDVTDTKWRGQLRVRVRASKTNPEAAREDHRLLVGGFEGTDTIRAEIHAKDTDGNYLAVCRAPEAAENELRLDALGNLISITALRVAHRELGGINLDFAVEDDVLPLDRADMTQQVGVEREVRRGGQP